METRPADTDAPFVDHLHELRKRILISAASVFVATIAAYAFADPLLQFFSRPILSETTELYFFSPQAAFFVKIKTAIFTGLLIVSPVVFSQVWLFVSPGLLQRERRFFIPLVLASSVLFMTGVVFTYMAVMPLVIRFLLGFGSEFLQPMISVSEYLGLLVSLSMAFGLAFNLPIAISFLVFLGVLNTQRLNRYRPHAVVAIFFAAAVMTPPDVISQFFLSVPLILLYEISVIASRFIRRPKNKP